MADHNKLYEIIRRLRAPDGCPWDKEQTPLTMLPNLIEEAYELVDAVQASDIPNIREELGDLFLNVSMITYMYEQENAFSLADVLAGICDKLVRRHPHVFDKKTDISVENVLNQWEDIKRNKEGKEKKTIFQDVGRHLHPVQTAHELQKKAAKVGFDWDSVDGIFDKIVEECGEVKEILDREKDERTHVDLEEEMGDLFFSAINLARYLKIDPALAVHRANSKFRERFQRVESTLEAEGLPLSRQSRDRMEEIWNEQRQRNE